jgi:uncharacterized membrane protein
MISTSPWVDDKEHLQEILARDEFNLPQSSGENWIQRAMEFVIELLADLFQWTNIPTGAANTVSTLVLIMAVLGLVGVIYWLFRRMIWVQKKHRPLFMDGEKIRSHADYLRDAKEKAARGEWREGERSLFLALLVYMQMKSWVRVEKWKTNWEYAEEIEANQPSLRDVFGSFAREFDAVWYGQALVDEGSFWQRVNELEGIWREEGQHG